MYSSVCQSGMLFEHFTHGFDSTVYYVCDTCGKLGNCSSLRICSQCEQLVHIFKSDCGTLHRTLCI